MRTSQQITYEMLCPSACMTLVTLWSSLVASLSLDRPSLTSGDLLDRPSARNPAVMISYVSFSRCSTPRDGRTAQFCLLELAPRAESPFRVPELSQPQRMCLFGTIGLERHYTEPPCGEPYIGVVDPS